eukprot:TRINITY_DN649_c0_g1_i15.p1 TRINITY_DN649_c0_g1~~TRINITY_DN649_c0_g1_i15.p1  ORF type:complete len:633 (-),score=259.21 TRINITY_DN649_c0_g1_i15:188-2086(-)
MCIRDRYMGLPGINEILVEVVSAVILTDYKAIHLTATRTFVDVYGKERKAGEEWLVTKEMASTHISDVYEKIVNEVNILVLSSNEHCYLLNPLENGINQMGKKILIKGPRAFFLNPGEQLDGSISANYILSDDEALLVKAVENYKDEEVGVKLPGDFWMIKGPRNFIPPVEVVIIEKRSAIPLDSVEGIYVRNYTTGAINSVIGKTYMLKADEDLFDKELPDVVVELLNTEGGAKSRRLSSVVTYRVPYNSAVQIYDYKLKRSRVVFGPELVMLNPDEQFTVNYLSGSTPKVPGRVKTLHVSLGPAFTTDKILQIETSDHARLEIQLSYNWRFQIEDQEKDGYKMFNVRDFIGDMCSSMASRIRATVASIPFDQFHKSSVRTIRKAIFGIDPSTNKVVNEVHIPENNLVVFNVDIQSSEPMDKRTKESLQKTVTQAIEITTKMQEQEARRQADKIRQEEMGKLECLILENEATVEEAKRELLLLKAESDFIKSKGQATAEAKANAEAAEILAKAEVVSADLRAQANKVREMASIEHKNSMNVVQLEYKKSLNELTIKKAQELAEIESGKFKKIMESIGQETLVNIAKAGPEMQSQMLNSLGLQGYMLMDSKNPINLFTAASGMVSAKEPAQE